MFREFLHLMQLGLLHDPVSAAPWLRNRARLRRHLQHGANDASTTGRFIDRENTVTVKKLRPIGIG